MKVHIVVKTFKDGSKEGVLFSRKRDAIDAKKGDCEEGSSLAIAWCETYGDSENIEMIEVDI